ncbi:MAG: urea ABC transporter ATP-binding subunit UrtE [Alphaproteobacteria bacterium]|jgi:urea transport system ATP-binding protein|nr:urea ABC transporter ATP-binding subunit UrtE [Alphaproteobacteria bacterium]
MLTVERINLFYGASHILRDLSIEAPVGQVTCVLGRNGVGKTSLIRAIFGLAQIRGGAIKWEGQPVDTIAPHKRARLGFGLVPQGREIFPRLTVEENLKTGFACLPRSERRIPDEIYELFPVLRDMRNRRGGDLSGGQQQQLAIGRALVTKPKLLVLDEPTEGIQPSIIKDIERVIRLLAQGGEMAILLVEQYYDFARALGQRLVVMERGEAVLSGAADDLAETEVRRYLTV